MINICLYLPHMYNIHIFTTNTHTYTLNIYIYTYIYIYIHITCNIYILHVYMVNILFLSGRTFNQVTFYGWSFSPWRGFPWHIFRGGSFRGGSFRILKNMCTKYILQPRSFQVFIKGTNDNNGRFFGSLAMDLADIIWRCVHLGSSILLTTTACILYKIFEN
jgi:hypothetical protein